MVSISKGQIADAIQADTDEVIEDIEEDENAIEDKLEEAGMDPEELEDDTKIIEAKNGPFVSVEVDKVKYE